MKRSELKKVMKENCIVECELDDVINFVCELLYLRRRELEKEEPYAIRTIDRLFNAEQEVYDLIEYISELEEDENV